MATTSAGTSAKNSLPSNVKTTLASDIWTSLGKHLHLFFFVLPIVALVVIYLQLRTLPAETLGHLAIGLIVVACALAGLGTFLWCVHWGVSRDGEPTMNIDPQPSSDEQSKEPTDLIQFQNLKTLADQSGFIAKHEVADQKLGRKVKL